MTGHQIYLLSKKFNKLKMLKVRVNRSIWSLEVKTSLYNHRKTKNKDKIDYKEDKLLTHYKIQIREVLLKIINT